MSSASLPVRTPLEVATSVVPVLKALSDDSRLAILLTLAEGSRSVVELTQELAISQPLVSHHLKALREAGLISVAAQGRSNRYALCCDAVAEPIRLLSALACAVPTDPNQKKESS
ncbi:MAG TPA: metalloregulator ArsR/SmtB family transcription factor [Acidimicrobiales bacterium]|nr:metalloregulator ArsR/SmtB family transcription factor [Acidimicrobiales bacterium]